MNKMTVLPPGSPPWITQEMIAKTIRVWQPYYKEEITEDDALEMLLNVGHLSNALGLGRTADISTPQAEAVARHDNPFVELVRTHLEQANLTPIQEGRLYEILTTEINPATGEKWKLKEIAQKFGKPYGHVRNRWALVMPHKADTVDENGKVIKKGQGLTADERSAVERGEKPPTDAIRQALRANVDVARSPVPLDEMQKLFDNSDEDDVERRKAIAECMGLTLRQATEQARSRRSADSKAKKLPRSGRK